MARLRKFSAYRRLERPYTRVSKFKRKNFVRANPNIVVARFEMGNQLGKFEYELNLISKDAVQIRHNALESARQTSNKILEKNIPKSEFHYKIRVYPHHILRENPLAAGAGADRFSTGMKHSFGKPVSSAAQVEEGQTLITLKVNKKHLQLAKKALNRAKHKLPCSCRIKVTQNS